MSPSTRPSPRTDPSYAEAVWRASDEAEARNNRLHDRLVLAWVVVVLLLVTVVVLVAGGSFR